MWVPDLADPGRMAAVFADHAGTLGLTGGAVACEVLDVRLSNPHRPGSPRCTGWGTYRLEPAGGARKAGPPGDRTSDGAARWYVRAYPPGGAMRAWAAEVAARPATRARLLPGVDLVAWPFPHDPGLPGLAGLLDPRSAAAYLPATGPAGTDGHVDVDVVRHQPEVSAVVRYRRRGAASGGVYAKLLAPGVADVARVADRHRRLWEQAPPGGPLTVAEPLGVDVEAGVLWTREVVGEPLVGVLDAGTAEAVADRLAALTAALHAADVAPLPTGDVALPTPSGLHAHVAEAEKKVAKLSAAHPPAAGRLAAVLAAGRALTTSVRSGSARSAGPRSVTVHGDLHVDQLLHTAGGLVLLDLDSVTSGPPELDLAELVVDLVLRPVPPDVVARLVPRVLRAYAARAPAGLDPAVLRALADAELVNRLYRHLRRHAPGWERGLQRDLDRHVGLVALLDDAVG